MAGLIYKILSVADWEAAQAAGRFDGSADDRRDGFIHFSDGGQVVGTASKYFSGQSGLVLLTVDPGRTGDLRWEKSRGDALFPHLYGALELDAVDRVDRLPDDRDAAEAIAALLGDYVPEDPGRNLRRHHRNSSDYRGRRGCDFTSSNLFRPSTISFVTHRKTAGLNSLARHTVIFLSLLHWGQAAVGFCHLCEHATIGAFPGAGESTWKLSMQLNHS
jgi:uncharacterized protein (DUF952 family)